MNQGRILISLMLLAILFYINIPPSEEELADFLGKPTTSSTTSSTPLNLSPYNVSIVEEINITDISGKVIGSVTKEYNKTITPEQPSEEPKSVQGSIMNIGAAIWPSNQIGGLIFLAVVLYMVVWPILKYLKGFVWD